jgi:hypothetical protein
MPGGLRSHGGFDRPLISDTAIMEKAPLLIVESKQVTAALLKTLIRIIISLCVMALRMVA